MDADVNCEDCFEKAEPDDFEKEAAEETESDKDYRVRCHSCGREIEFGWAGREDDEAIFPVEASDFDPKFVNADEKYEDAWAERGWA